MAAGFPDYLRWLLGWRSRSTAVGPEGVGDIAGELVAADPGWEVAADDPGTELEAGVSVLNAGTFEKAAADVRYYALNWGRFKEWLAGETLALASVAVTPAGPVLSGKLQSGERTQFWASGGTAGASYTLQFTVTTSGGATLYREATLQID